MIHTRACQVARPVCVTQLVGYTKRVMRRRLRALCSALDAPGCDEIGEIDIGEIDSEIERLLRSIASPTAGIGVGAHAAPRAL